VSKVSHQPELSRCVDITKITEDGTRLVFEATKTECDALSARFGLQALRSLVANTHILKEKKADGNWIIKVSTAYSCELEQICVISLENLKVELSDAFEVLFLSPSNSKILEDSDLESVVEDIYEPICGSELDVGELVAQYLALAIDPYPKHPRASLVEKSAGIVEDVLEEESNNPFAILGQLKDKM